MTPEGLLAFRISAALVGAFRGLRVRVRDGEATVLEIGCPPRGSEEGAAHIEAEVFRRTVLHIWAQARRGQPVSVVGLGGPRTPRVEVAIPPDGADLGVGAYRLPVGELDRYVFATVLDQESCTDLVREMEAPAVPPGAEPLRLDVRVFHDEATEIRLVCLDASPQDRDAAVDVVYQLLGAVLSAGAAAALTAAAES